MNQIRARDEKNYTNAKHYNNNQTISCKVKLKNSAASHSLSITYLYLAVNALFYLYSIKFLMRNISKASPKMRYVEDVTLIH